NQALALSRSGKDRVTGRPPKGASGTEAVLDVDHEQCGPLTHGPTRETDDFAKSLCPWKPSRNPRDSRHGRPCPSGGRGTSAPRRPHVRAEGRGITRGRRIARSIHGGSGNHPSPPRGRSESASVPSVRRRLPHA